MRLRTAIALVVLALSPQSAAQTIACETTSECGALRCIDGRCTDVATALQRGAPSPRERAGMITGGVALIVVGLGTLAAGIALTAASLTSHACGSFGCDSPPYALLGVAVPVDVTALASVIGGSVMIAFGARRAPQTILSFSPTGLRVVW